MEQRKKIEGGNMTIDFRKDIGEIAFKLIQAKVHIEHKNYEEARKLAEEVRTKAQNMKDFDERLLSQVLEKLEEMIKNDSTRI